MEATPRCSVLPDVHDQPAIPGAGDVKLVALLGLGGWPGTSAGSPDVDEHFGVYVPKVKKVVVYGGPAFCAAGTNSYFRLARNRCRFLTLNYRFTYCYNHVNVKLH